MRSAFRHVRARAAVALLSAGLIAVPTAAGSATASAAAGGALAAGCAWNLRVAPLPAGYSDFTAAGARNRYFVGGGHGPDGHRSPLLWDDVQDTVTVLDAPDQHQAVGVDVNNHGVVVAQDLDTDRPYLWNRGRIVKLVRPSGATSVLAGAINDAGTVVGSAMIDDQRHGIVWSTHSPRKYQDLGPGEGWLYLNDISESGTIVAGTRSDEDGNSTALKGTADGGFSRLEGLDDTRASAARHVAGTYIEGSGTWPGDTHESSIRWNGDTAEALPYGFYSSDVNSSGLVAGSTSDPFGPTDTGQAAVWDGETVTTLPNYRPEGMSSTAAVTENGTVFGVSQAEEDPWYGGLPIIWTCS